MLRLLEDKGILTRKDVHDLMRGILLRLEQDDAAADPVAHVARQLLAGFCRRAWINLPESAVTLMTR